MASRSPASRPAEPLRPDTIPDLRRALLRWYGRVRRDLPWRGTTDAWRIWVSEIMLQQTTVTAVVPHYERFLHRFPSVESFAHAPLDEALAAWSGLGYYSRARNLHAAARVVVAEHGGRLPSDPATIRSLPGVGDYTAAALLSIVHGQARAVVDGNVVRVVARVLALPGDAKSGTLKRSVQGAVDAWIDPRHPGDFNQAMMELGATVCTPTSPDCGSCPVRRHCRAALSGDPTRWPAAPARKPTRDERWFIAIIRRGDRLLLRRRDEKESLMPGLWELPSWKTDDTEPRRLASRLREIDGSARLGGAAGEARHMILDRRMRLSLFHATLDGSCRPRLPFKWIREDRLHEIGTSSMVKKILAAATALTLLLHAGPPAHAGADVTVTAAAAESVKTTPQIVIPDLALKTITGKSLTLHEMLRGGPVLLDFWALWCKPCLKELPELEKLQQAWRSKGVTVLAINADSPADVARVAPFVHTRGFTFPVVADLDGSIRRRMEVNALPTTILLDPTGRTAWTNQGYRPGDTVKIEEELRKLFGMPADSTAGK